VRTWHVIVVADLPLTLMLAALALPAPAHLLLYAALVLMAATLAAVVASGLEKVDYSKGFDTGQTGRTVNHGLLVALSTACGAGSLVLVLGSNWPPAGLVAGAIEAAWYFVWLPPRFRRMTATCSIVINRDPATVFELMSDFRTMVRWYPGVQSEELMTPEPIGPGTRFRARVQLSTGPATGVDEIVDYQPPHLYSSTTLGQLKNLDVVTFEPTAGGTLVTLKSEVELSPWMALVGAGLMKRALSRTTVSMREAAWANAKRLLESPAVTT
jgi:carbon monoxide dehydrogenase subunit G